ncbi:nucleoredoxin isoform X2 [Kogia breviceps]|uniref:nucleoredoxin isoform X2 n=1 Tax=Kogia breviceps TaxID=27615 RepID=UPI0034D311F6
MSGFLEELLGEKLVTGGGEEVDVHSLAARGISLLGLYFGCSLSAPCAQLSVSLAAFYGRLRGDAAAGPGAGAGPGPGAGAAAEPESRRRLEIVFVSSDQDQRQWQDFVRDMPWLALPYKEKHRKLKLWNKYRISNIPSLIFLDATTGKVVCRNGLLVIRDDPEGLEFPWGPKPFREVIAGPLLRNNGQSLESSSLEGSHVGVYFSAHWVAGNWEEGTNVRLQDATHVFQCPPCRSLTRVLVESYRKIKEAGQKFEIIFVSADRSEDSFKQYFSEMPWLAVPYTDEARRSRLNRLYGIQGIPTLIVLDPQGEVITRQGRVEVLNDEDCRGFPWHPKPVLELSDSNAVQLNEGPCLVLFVDSEDDGESEAAKQLIQPIAEKIIAKYKAKEEEAPLLFFVAGEDDMTDSLRDYTNLPEAAPLLTILDMSARANFYLLR